MAKIEFKPGTMLNPVPAVMVSCGDETEQNIITIAWTGIVNTDPPMTYISVRKERHSHDIIARTGEFVINLTTKDLAFATDYCGVKSGRDVDKFAAMNLIPMAAPGLTAAPAVAQAPAFLSCKLHSVTELGSHDLFLARVVQVSVQDRYFRPDGSIDEDAMELVSYIHGKYHATGEALGFFGYSLASPQALRRRGFGEERK